MAAAAAVAVVAAVGLAIAVAVLTAPASSSLSWGKPVRMAGLHGGLSAISCPTATDCLAVDAHGDAATWNGKRWSAAVPAIAGAAGLDALSCPSAGFCAAGGNRLWTGHGTQWATGPPVDDWWRAVSCPSATFCAAATGDGYVSEFNGRAWSAPVRIDSDVPESITVSCASAARCLAMDGYGYVYEWNGARWTPSRQNFDKYASLGCAPDGFCMVLDSGAAYTSTGSSWTASAAAAVHDDSALGHLSCESAGFCMFLDAEGTADVYDGKGWRRFPDPVLPAPAGGYGYVPGALACSLRTCAAVLDATAPVANVYGPGA